jgi:hypothetical protein
MFLGICAVSKAGGAPPTPERASKRPRPSDAAVSSSFAAPAEAAAAEALRDLGAVPAKTAKTVKTLHHKKRLCFLFADSAETPAIVGAMLVHQFGGGTPFTKLCEFADVPVPLHHRKPVALSQRAAAYLRAQTSKTPILFQDFAAPDAPRELNDILEALYESGNLHKSGNIPHKSGNIPHEASPPPSSPR